MKNLILYLIFITINLNAQSNIALLSAPTNDFVSANTNFTAAKSTAFELVGGMIFIEANVNGRVGNFILDTGAPGIILNDVPTKTSEELQAGGIAGNINIGQIKIDDFSWGNIKLSNCDGYVLDISHLEKSLDRTIAGLIGFDVLADFELLFDYDNKLIQILDARDNELHRNNKPVKKIAFQKQGHLPVIQAKIGRKNYHFGLDTGAEVNLLDKAVFEQLPGDLIQEITAEAIQGLGDQEQIVQAAIIEHTQVATIDFPKMKFLAIDFSAINKNQDISIDGLLGFDFLQQSKVSINYKKQKIYIW